MKFLQWYQKKHKIPHLQYALSREGEKVIQATVPRLLHTTKKQYYKNVDIEYMLDGFVSGGGKDGKDLAIEINGNF